MNSFSIALLLLTITCHFANSIRTCHYACNCDDCETITEQKCLNNNDFCYSMKEDSGIWSRGCVNQQLAKEICVGKDKEECWLCVGDLCNFGSRTVVSTFLLASVFGFILLM